MLVLKIERSFIERFGEVEVRVALLLLYYAGRVPPNVRHQKPGDASNDAVARKLPDGPGARSADGMLSGKGSSLDLLR
jgi:hypothetical protein